jgi:hypothetical protein
MATDSVVTFKYSDGIPLLTIYIKSDSHLETFIPKLQKIIEESDTVSMRRSWDYVVAEIVSRLIRDRHFQSLIKICHIHLKSKDCNTIFRHVISINEDYYSKQDNLLKDFVTIESEYPISKTKIANCLLFNFPKELL